MAAGLNRFLCAVVLVMIVGLAVTGGERGATGAAAVSTPQTMAATAAAPGRIFDTTLYLKKPAVTGMSKMHMLYGYMSRDFKGTLTQGIQPFTSAQSLNMLLDQADSQGVKYIVLDIEAPYGGDKTQDESVLRVARAVKARKPNMLVGAFSYPHMGPIGMTDAEMRAANDAIKPILALLDFAVTEAYLHGDPASAADRADWLAYLQMGVDEAKRTMLGKPIMPTLNLSIADYGWKKKMTVQGPLPVACLLEQIKAAQVAGGGDVILWGATKAKPNSDFVDWEPNAEWYQAMLKANLISMETPGRGPGSATTTGRSGGN